MRPLATLLLLALAPAAALANGNVTTERTDNGLIIRGDAGNNEFDVKYGTDAQGNDVLVVEGKNGTTVNGQAKFEVSLPAGNAKISELDIELVSGGTDKVTVDLGGLPAAKRFSDVDIDDASGTTTVKNVNVEAGKLRVQTLGGDATIESCDAGELSVKAEGSGSVTVRDCDTNKLKIVNAGENTTLTVEDSFYQSGSVKSAGKAEVEPSLRARIQRTTGKKISFQSAGGDDEVAFEDNTIESVSVKLGDGSDLASFTDSTIDKLSVDGGSGEVDCLDETGGGNTFASFKEKGFEPNACLGLELDFLPPGSDPFAAPPEGAVAWLVSDGSHEDGPFALPGAENPFGLPVLDPQMLPPPAHWGQGPECVDGATQLHHVHDAFDGHGDPNPDGCGHGMLSWGFLVPI